MSRTRLSVQARPLGPAADLLSFYEPDEGFFFERSGLGLVTAGSCQAIEVGGGLERAGEVVLAALAEMRKEGDGPAPIAVGGFRFDGQGPHTLTIPWRALVRTESLGPTWELSSGGPPPRARRAGVGRQTGPDAGDVRARAVPEPEVYAAAVAEATRLIRDGRLRKIVLARQVEIEADRTFDAAALLQRLRAVDPACYTFAVRSGDGRVLVGATPELLVRRSGRDMHCRPLAGSAPRHGDPRQDERSAGELLGSAKEQDEHAIVVEGLVTALGPLCDELDRDPEPRPLATANVWHLATDIRGRLRDPAPTAIDIVGALHPTAAVCGAPTGVALELIDELEHSDRGLYAGPVGWMDANGDGEWAIALRCAELSGPTARLYAGAGIVAGSDPAKELDETERKFRALLDSLRWG